MEQTQLEGVLIKPGRTRKKAWKKRLFRRVVTPEGDDELLYFQGKNCKGRIDLKLVISVNAAEEQTKHDGNQYFLFELEMIGGETETFGAKDRIDLKYWIEGLQEILVKRGTLQQVSFSSASDFPDIVPPLAPGETLINFVPDTYLMVWFKEKSVKKREYAVVNLFLTNHKLHLISVDQQTPIPPDTIKQPYHGLGSSPLHSVPIPGILIVKTTSKSAPGLQILCRDTRRISVKWKTSEMRQLVLYHLHLYSPVKPEDLFAFEHFRSLPEVDKAQHVTNTGYYKYNPIKEFHRLGIPNDDWRVSTRNSDYTLSPSYPSLLAIPASVDDTLLKKLTSHRTRKRIPVLSYLYGPNGMPLVRCSQPRRGVTNTTSRDAAYLDCFSVMSPDKRLYIYDSRSFAAAQANRTLGGGFEDYKNVKVTFCDVDNIHAVRTSWEMMVKLCDKGNRNDPSWYTKLMETGWLLHLYRILTQALKIVKKIVVDASPVLVHCSDGWDRTSQATALSMLLMDPYYRSLDGFVLLIEKEWLSFGHQFQLRCGFIGVLGKTSNEESPIFLQFLECAYHLSLLYPTAFEFNEDFLLQIFDHLCSGLFGTFLFDCERQRMEAGLGAKTTSLWAWLDKERRLYTNSAYVANPNVLMPAIEMRQFRLWERVWIRSDDDLLVTATHLRNSQHHELLAAIQALQAPRRPVARPPPGTFLSARLATNSTRHQHEHHQPAQTTQQQVQQVQQQLSMQQSSSQPQQQAQQAQQAPQAQQAQQAQRDPSPAPSSAQLARVSTRLGRRQAVDSSGQNAALSASSKHGASLLSPPTSPKTIETSSSTLSPRSAETSSSSPRTIETLATPTSGPNTPASPRTTQTPATKVLSSNSESDDSDSSSSDDTDDSEDENVNYDEDAEDVTEDEDDSDSDSGEEEDNHPVPNNNNNLVSNGSNDNNNNDNVSNGDNNADTSSSNPNIVLTPAQMHMRKMLLHTAGQQQRQQQSQSPESSPESLPSSSVSPRQGLSTVRTASHVGLSLERKPPSWATLPTATNPTTSASTVGPPSWTMQTSPVSAGQTGSTGSAESTDRSPGLSRSLTTSPATNSPSVTTNPRPPSWSMPHSPVSHNTLTPTPTPTASVPATNTPTTGSPTTNTTATLPVSIPTMVGSASSTSSTTPPSASLDATSLPVLPALPSLPPLPPPKRAPKKQDGT